MRTIRQWLNYWLIAAMPIIIEAISPGIPASGQEKLVYPEIRVSNLPKPEKVRLYNETQDVVEPVLLPRRIPVLDDHCNGEKKENRVTLSLIIDSNGDPRNIMFKKANGDQVDILALNNLVISKFQPAMLSGSPVAFGLDVEMHLEVCNENASLTSNLVIRLRALPEMRLIKWSRPPAEANLAPLHMPADALGDAEHAGTGFVTPKIIVRSTFDSKGMSGSFAFGTRIDEHGIDHVEKVLKSTNDALLPLAVSMVQSARSVPAMKDGMPIPVHLLEELQVTASR